MKDEMILVDKANEMIPYLNDDNYDFGDIGNYLSIKFKEIEEEKIRQDRIMNIVKEKTREKFKNHFILLGKKDEFEKNFDDYFSCVFRIKNYNNYYFVYFYGMSHNDMKFIFDKDGEKVIEEGIIYRLDNDNFCVIKNKTDEDVSKLYHYQLKDDVFEMVNCIDNVNDIDRDYSNFFKKDRFVVCSCDDGKLLYNYKYSKIFISNFSSLSDDLKGLKRFAYGNENRIRLIKKIFIVENFEYVLISKLEFLVNEYGRIDDNVPLWDFENGRFYYLRNSGTQVENLNYIYDKVKDEYKSNVVEFKKRVKK